MSKLPIEHADPFANFAAPEGFTLGYQQEEGYGGNPSHTWFAKNADGAVHIWARLCTYPDGKFPPDWIGGVECHWATCPEMSGWFKPEAPSQPDCWLLNGPCWHDGSSLYFSENLAHCLPVPYGDDPNNFDRMPHEYFGRVLLNWHRDKIAPPHGDTQ